MANILVYRHEFDQAEPYARIALHGDPSSLPRVHALLAKIYAFRGHIREAIAELKQALPDDPDGSLHYQIARLYQQVGDEKAASEALRQSETLRKDQEHKAQTTIQSVE
jgi:Tfp pilus assembly protein PilF